jgi:hypothetical protein
MGPSPPPYDHTVLQRTLEGYQQAMASFAASFPGGFSPVAPGAAFVQASLQDAYRHLIAAAAPVPAYPPATGASPAAAMARFQAATVRWGELVAAIARDAAGRLAHALQQTGPGAPPITSLAALQALWIDCGEAAYREAAHRDEFAAAQAELLMALAELRVRP